MIIRATSAAVIAILVGVIASACGGEARNTFTADKHSLHLEDHIADAVIKGGEVPRADLETFEWRFSEPQPAWKVARWSDPAAGTAELERTPDALRVTLPDGFRSPNGSLGGGIYIDLPDWNREEWPHVEVRARATGRMDEMSIGLNPREGIIPPGARPATFQARGGGAAIIPDGSVQTHRVALDWRQVPPAIPWRRVGLWFSSWRRGSECLFATGIGVRFICSWTFAALVATHVAPAAEMLVAWEELAAKGLRGFAQGRARGRCNQRIRR